MTKTLTVFGFLLVLSLFTVGISSGLLQNAEAQGDADMQCRSGQVLVYHFNMRKYICTSESGAQQWVQHGIAEIVSPVMEEETMEEEAMKEETMEEEAMKEETMEEEAMEEETMEEAAPTMEPKIEEKMMPDAMWQSATGTMQSMVDPGMDHETHQLAIILPPTDKVYKGILSYDASEPIQLVALHGPLADGEDMGQPIWTPDGETKFALTLVDPETSMGSWVFTGNALAVHTMNEEQFTVSYSVSYMEKEMSDTVMTGTLNSMLDPGIGHETHQLAIILPPSENTYGGILTYASSEPIQLVALHGPLAEGEDMGQAIWTPDGETKFALTFVDPETNMGMWAFAGNALAVHTMNEEQFTVSYSVVAGQ